MAANPGVWKKKRDDLKTRRDSLFATYTKRPHDFHLAREIKALDDEIADCTQRMEQERRFERAASSGARLQSTHK